MYLIYNFVRRYLPIIKEGIYKRLGGVEFIVKRGIVEAL